MTNHLNSGKPKNGNPEPSSLKREGAETMAKASRSQAGSKRVASRTDEEIVRSLSKDKAVVLCNKCKQPKVIAEDFYGENRVCKDCYKKRVSTYQRTPEGKSSHNKANSTYILKHPDRNKETKKNFKNSEGGRCAERRYYRSKMERSPEKLRARALVNTAVRRGKIYKPERCSVCGRLCKVSGHHSDYAKPLNVEWLCHECHKIADAK
jgi:hypothetical protein